MIKDYFVEIPIEIKLDTHYDYVDEVQWAGGVIAVDSFWTHRPDWDMGGWSQISGSRLAVQYIIRVHAYDGYRYLIRFYPISHGLCTPFQYYGLEYFDGSRFKPSPKRDKCSWCDSNNIAIIVDNREDTFIYCNDCNHETLTDETLIKHKQKIPYSKPQRPEINKTEEFLYGVKYLFFASFRKYYVVRDTYGNAKKNWVVKQEYLNWKTKSFEPMSDRITCKGFLVALALVTGLRKRETDNLVGYSLMEKSQADFIRYMTQGK